MNVRRFIGEEVTIETLKESCNIHVREKMPVGMVCDILASDRGPSCTKISHLPNLKVIHVRFIKGGRVDIQKNGSILTSSKFNASSILNKPVFKAMPKTIPILPSSSAAASAFPKSLPVSKMLKLGKVITDVKRQYEEITFDKSTIFYQCVKSLKLKKKRMALALSE